MFSPPCRILFLSYYVAIYVFYLWGTFYVILFPPGGWGPLWAPPGCRQGSARCQWLEGLWLFPKGCCKSVTFPWPLRGGHSQVTSLPRHLGATLGAKGAAQGCCPRWWQRLPLLCCPFPSHTWLRTPGSPSAILPCSGKLRQGAVPGVRSCVPLIWGALGHHKALAAFAQMPKWCFPPSPPMGKPKDGFLGLWGRRRVPTGWPTQILA